VADVSVNLYNPIAHSIIATNKKNTRVNILPIRHCCDASTGIIAFIFDVWGDITSIVTHAKFYVNRFWGFNVLIALADHPYNSVVYLARLQCKKHEFEKS